MQKPCDLPARNFGTSSANKLARRFGFVGLCIVLAAPTAQAQSSRCGAIADAVQRLACYDQETGTHAANPNDASHWPEFGGPVAASRPPPSPVKPVVANRIVSRVTSFTFTKEQRFVVVLENGQVWRQLPADSGVAQFRKSGVNRVMITRGFWNSHDLRLNDLNAIFKVELVR